MRLAVLITAAALPLPALAQSMPPACMITRQCMGEACRDMPGTMVYFRDDAEGLVAWDNHQPDAPISLSPLPGEAPVSWTGRLPGTGSAVLLSQISPTEAVISIHMIDALTPQFTAPLNCAVILLPPPSVLPPPPSVTK